MGRPWGAGGDSRWWTPDPPLCRQMPVWAQARARGTARGVAGLGLGSVQDAGGWAESAPQGTSPDQEPGYWDERGGERWEQADQSGA